MAPFLCSPCTAVAVPVNRPAVLYPDVTRTKLGTVRSSEHFTMILAIAFPLI